MQVALDRGFSYVEDPSNQDSRYFRNWLRNEWLPQLEKRYPGSILRLIKSLTLLTQAGQNFPKLLIDEGDYGVRVRLSSLMYLTHQDRGRCIVRLLNKLKIHDYRQSQILELLKQIDSHSTHRDLRIAGCFWSWNRTWLYARNAKKR
jgi:tRNA(Ile)-lysidine synthase TilS/MesJ